jgi:hypothetical protein
VSLRIGFDLDGVLADMQSELVRQATTLFGPSVTSPSESPSASQAPPEDVASLPETDAAVNGVDVAPKTRLRITPRQERRLWQQVESIEGFWESLDEIEPGAVARLAALASERRWEVIFLTKRPTSAGATVQVQSQRWLEARGYRLPSVFVVHGSRGRVAAALGLDFVVDDRPENCLDVVVDSNAGALLVWRQGDEEVPVAAKQPGISVVRSVEDCLAILSEVDSSSRLQPGFVDRVMQKLGLGKGSAARGYARSRKLPNRTSSKS